MQNLVMVGVSHRTSSISVLEGLATPPERIPALLEDLRVRGIVEAVVLSTCSRTEVYAAAPGAGAATAIADVLAARHTLPLDPAPDRWVRLQGRQVAHHLLRVAAGLESRVAGEVEIQVQVRATARVAEQQGSMGVALRQLFDAAIATARRAHRDTALGQLSRSVGRTGVDTALVGLEPRAVRAAVVGTGRIATVAVERLAELGITPTVYARSPEGASRVPVAPSRIRGLDRLGDGLRWHDLVVCATSSSVHLITAAAIVAARQGGEGRPVTLVDLGVPRNIEPATRAAPGVRLIDLEDLDDDHRRAGRLVVTALDEASEVVRAGLARLEAADQRRRCGAVLAQLHCDVEDACRELYQRRPELAGGTIDRAARAASRRLVHHSMGDVLAALERGDLGAVADITRRLTESIEPPPPAQPVLTPSLDH